MRQPKPLATEHSALDESTYDLVDECAITSDDEDGTTLSSLGGDTHTPDDILSMAGTEDHTEEEEEAEQFEVSQTEFTTSSACRIDDSELTARGNSQSSTQAIMFDELRNLSRGNARSLHHIESFDASHVYGVFVKVTAEMCLSLKHLALKRPLRILHAGPSGTIAKHEIIDKIAAAIVSQEASRMESSIISDGSSRFTMVPISSFGQSDSKPDVEVIESFGMDLIVDDCTSATIMRRSFNQPFRCKISINNRKSYLFDSKGVVQPCDPPDSKGYKPHDLAVFFRPESSSSHLPEEVQDEEYFDAVRNAMEACNIPVIDISEAPLYGDNTRSTAFTKGALRLRIDSADGLSRGLPRASAIDVLPIDLQTFLAIDASQLNRHIAYLVDSHRGRVIAGQMAMYDVVRAKAKPIIAAVSDKWNRFYHVAQGFGLKKVLALLLFALLNVLMSISFHKYSGTNDSMQPSVSVDPSPMCRSTFSISTPATKPSSPVVPELTSPSVAVRITNGGIFMGQNQIILDLPQEIYTPKKLKYLAVEVSRNGKPVGSSVTIVQGEHQEVRILPDQPHGTIDVTLRMTSKPISTQTFRVDLGNPVLSLNLWQGWVHDVSKNVEHGFGSNVAKLKQMSTTAVGVFQGAVEQSRATTDLALREAGELTVAVKHWTLHQAAKVAYERRKLKSKVLKESQQLAKSAKQARRAASDGMAAVAEDIKNTWTREMSALRKWQKSLKRVDLAKYWSQTPSVYTPDAVGRAQRNAQGIIGMLKGRPRTAARAEGRRLRSCKAKHWAGNGKKCGCKASKVKCH